MTSKKKSRSCEKCGSHSLKARRTTYPIKIGEKQLDVGRVSVRECLDCHHLMPTEAGKEKLGRCLMTFMNFMDGS